MLRVDREEPGDEASVVTFHEPRVGFIAADLRVGASPAAAVPLEANQGVAFWGVKFYGDGFILTSQEAAALAAAQGERGIARPFVSGKDLTGAPRRLLVLDCDGLTEDDLARDYPASYQRLLDRVKPVRAHNPRAFKRERWWIFGENQPGMRAAVRGLSRFIATTETAKHPFFQFFGAETLAEGTVAVFAFEDAISSASSPVALTSCGRSPPAARSKIGRVTTRRSAFEPFPFPAASEAQQALIRELGEALDAHRKRQQAQHPKLTLTDIYNVLERLRAGEPLNAKE